MASTATPTNTRRKLVSTIVVLYVAGLIGIGVYAVRSAHHFAGRDAVPSRQGRLVCDPNTTDTPYGDSRMTEARCAAAAARGEPPPTFGACVYCGPPARPPRTTYERETITTSLIALTLAAAVLAGAVLIWTRSKGATTMATPVTIGSVGTTRW